MLEPFDCYSPGAQRLYWFEGTGQTPLLAGEVRRTLDAIAASAPARIDKGSLTRDEAAQLANLWLAIAEDLEALVDRAGQRAPGRAPREEPRHLGREGRGAPRRDPAPAIGERRPTSPRAGLRPRKPSSSSSASRRPTISTGATATPSTAPATSCDR
jgi:hypothetical protein